MVGICKYGVLIYLMCFFNDAYSLEVTLKKGEIERQLREVMHVFQPLIECQMRHYRRLFFESVATVLMMYYGSKIAWYIVKKRLLDTKVITSAKALRKPYAKAHVIPKSNADINHMISP